MTQKTFFVVTAYRWGWTNNHSFVVHVGDDEEAACNAAIAENTTSGGKYGCEVLQYPEEASVLYRSSSRGEDRPYYNHRIALFEDVGREVVTELESESPRQVSAWIIEVWEKKKVVIATIYGAGAVKGDPTKRTPP